jgi:hypothetical protein
MKTIHCASSYLVPCDFNMGLLTSSKDYKNKTHARYSAKVLSSQAVEEIKALEDGLLDESSPADLYIDLRFRKEEGEQGRFFGDPDVGIIGGLLSGIGGVICGIASIIASCVDERAYGNGMVWAILILLLTMNFVS